MKMSIAYRTQGKIPAPLITAAHHRLNARVVVETIQGLPVIIRRPSVAAADRRVTLLEFASQPNHRRPPRAGSHPRDSNLSLGAMLKSPPGSLLFYQPRGKGWNSHSHLPELLAAKKNCLTVRIEGAPCLMEMDTGSATSIVSWSTIKCLVPKITKKQLKQCDMLRDYQGNPVPIVGSSKFNVQFKNFAGCLPQWL